MTGRLAAVIACVGALVVSGYATSVIDGHGRDGEASPESMSTELPSGSPATSAASTVPSSAAPVASAAPATTETSAAPTTSATTEASAAPATSATTEASAATVAPTTVGPTTTPTTTEPPLDVHDAECVVRSSGAITMEQLVDDDGPASGLDPVALWFENDGSGLARPGDLVDVCPGNGVDDVTGDPRPLPEGGALAAALAADAVRQQERLNVLFEPFGADPLAVDGVTGSRTRQRICAARLAFGLPTSRAELRPGTIEHELLFAVDALPTPPSASTDASRWALIDKTCQIMFVGALDETAFVFPTSTGEAGHETRDQDRSRAFRFNPARENGGWHNSTEFPVGVDNPLNGNLYKPIFFDAGQAIHGANSVPASPASKGCARLRVSDQDLLVSWLGLDDVPSETWQSSRIDLVVDARGAYVPD